MTASEEMEKPKYTPGPNAVDITPNQDGGVLKEIIKEGEGDAKPGTGCVVTAHYHGTLLDGTVFDSSKGSGKPFEFTLGKEQVIKAWDLGVSTMKKGEVAMLTCKPEYAYGKKGSPPKIPPDSTLVFEITLLGWQAEDISKDKDKGILRTIIEKGKGYSTPNEGALVEVHLTGKYGDKVFEDRDVTFNLGEGSEFGVIEGVEMALTHFKQGEKSSLEIKPKYAFQKEGHKEFGIPPDAVVTYIVELKNFEKAKESWDMDAPEKIAQAKLLKEKATNYFKAGKYNLAVKLYKNAMQYIDSDAGFSGEGENAEREALLLAITLNLGLTYLKLNMNSEAKKECDNALKLDPNNVKGLFRRGQAYLNMNEPENAKLDFEAVVRLEPTNKLASNQIIICCNKIKQQREREKKIYANMFEKFAQKDKEDASVRFGWWDDEKKKPIIEMMEPEFEDDEEDVKADKKRQLEHLRKVAEAKRRELEAQKLCSDAPDKTEENTETEESKKTEENTETKEESVPKEPVTMKLGEWGKEERDREPTEFEQENPDILMLNKNDEFKNM